MCLITKQKKAKFTWKPITCYKIVEVENRKIKSIFNYFEWELGTEYHTKMKVSKIVKADSGSFYDNVAAVKYLDGVNLISVSKGFHSTLETKRLVDGLFNDNQYIVKCVIPRFSFYFEDETGLLVSNRIKLIDFIK